MAIEWITPKTNWVASDFINYTDYSRIRNNLLFLERYCYSLFNFKYENMVEKNAYSQYPYADELNVIENNLETLNKASYGFNIGNTQTYADNKVGWNYTELNRIESALLRLYNRIGISRVTLPFMEFKLGCGRNFRR